MASDHENSSSMPGGPGEGIELFYADYKLPCDVRIGDTVITKGCTLGTLMQSIKLREGYEEPEAQAQGGGDATFAEWLATEMPAGTVIGDPAWWADRIARQYAKRCAPPSAPVGVEGLVAKWRDVYEKDAGDGWNVAHGRCANELEAALTKQPAAEAHCATCACVPGMTPAVRFDTTPAEREGVVRDHLIRMGWTPPAEAQAQGGGEGVACWRMWRTNTITGEWSNATPWQDGAPDAEELRDAERASPDGKLRYRIEFAYTAPPSAPVGVAGDAVRGLVEQWRGRGMSRTECANELEAAIAQDRASQAAPPSAPVGVELQSFREFVDQWRRSSDGNGHDVIANRNTVRRFVSGIDALLAQQPAAKPDAFAVFAGEGGRVFRLSGYDGDTEAQVLGHVLARARREGFAGTAQERMAELGWWIEPMFRRSAQQPAAVDGAMVRLAKSARELQRKNYGSGCGLHLDMIDWAREFDALAAQPQGGA